MMIGPSGLERQSSPGVEIQISSETQSPVDHDGWMWDLTVPGNNDYDFYVAASLTAVLVHNIDDEQRGLFDEGPYRATNAKPVQASLKIGDDSFAGTCSGQPADARRRHRGPHGRTGQPRNRSSTRHTT